MAYARTQLGARKRVVMKRALRRRKISLPPNVNNKTLRNVYKVVYGKAALRKVMKMTMGSRYP